MFRFISYLTLKAVPGSYDDGLRFIRLSHWWVLVSRVVVSVRRVGRLGILGVLSG
jgi:hypothetical protein